MRVIHGMQDFGPERSVVALGTFDGVHIGHQELIRNAVTLARSLDARCVVCTFDRHPLSVLRPDRAPKPLLTLEQNLLKFERLGADYALVKAFTPEFAAMAPEEYLRQLVTNMRVRAIVVGENYTFGAGGRGDAEMIRSMAGELGYRALVVAPVMDGSVMASSTYVRALLAAGETAHAHRLLDIPVSRG